MLGACAFHLLVGSWQKMASAKFLEEALSTDVDESAVNAIVGSLETQLVTASPSAGPQVNAAPAVNQNHVNSAISNGGTVVPPTSTQKHGVTNGGAGESVNILSSSSDPTKSASLASSSVSHPVVGATNIANTVVGALPASGFLNQIQTTASAAPPPSAAAATTPVTAPSQPVLTTTTLPNKPHEHLKIVYANNSQTLTTSAGVVTLNNSRVTFPAGTLPNGTVNLVGGSPSAVAGTSQPPPPQQQQQQPPPVLTAVTPSVQSVVSQSSSNLKTGNEAVKQVPVTLQQSPQQGPALVIKTNTAAAGTSAPQLATGVMTVPITTMAALAGGVTHASGSPGVVTLTKNLPGGAQTMVGGHPAGTTLMPANVQILNVNAMRPGAPGGPGQKGIPQRVVFGAPHMMGARPGQPGQITLPLQTLQGLTPGQGGTLLLKTENGQYQLLRVGAAPTTPAAAAITPTTSAGPGAAAAGMPTTYRFQTVPVTTTPRPQTPMQQQQSMPSGPTPTSTVVQTVAAGQPALSAAAQAAAAQAYHHQHQQREYHLPPFHHHHPNYYYKQALDSTKEKCRKFLANLLELSSREPKQVERNVRILIQDLIDTKVEPDDFCDKLEKLLNASPQPCLIGFLKKSLPLLRQALITKELVIDGIRPPPAPVVFSLAQGGMMVPHLQARGGTVLTTHLRPVGQAMGTTQVRVVTPGGATPGASPGPGQVLTGLPRAPHVQHRIVTPMQTRPQMTAAQSKLQPVPTLVSTVASSGKPPAPVTMVTVRHPTPVSAATAAAAAAAAAAKPQVQAKEKKTFSSSGYAGDDDINDVAAMGGVNLAEESQRILGSTEFVGTQIHSCKDDIFLNAGPLQQRIKQIMAKHGLDEPCSSEVASLISHAAQERLKNLAEKLAVVAEHRLDGVKLDPRYEVVQDVKSQLRFLEELDRVERRRHEEQERELLLRAAKSRSKSEDPEQAKLKAKAKEMQRAEMEELRQREANLTALQAIGPRKKPKLDQNGSPGTSGQSSTAGPSGSSSGTSSSRASMPLRPRVKRVNLRDLLFLLEQERETCRTPLLYKAYLK